MANEPSTKEGAGKIGFRTLSHAGLQVQAGGKELLCDPWLIGSCYWRSWWNYPPVPRSLVDSLSPDFIYLTHLHWDHFQGPSLRLFPRDTQMLIPYDRYDRMVRDLAEIGMRNVREVRHGERIELAPGLAIRSYHFSPFVTDSAVVIEAGDVVLVNANDAKLAGAPLRQLLSDYPSVDFCLRSHSSANPRACFHVTDEPEVEVDDNEHYLRAFSLFIERVKPKFAIPFLQIIARACSRRWRSSARSRGAFACRSLWWKPFSAASRGRRPASSAAR
jgi:UDP-MurNAc hydroxylase